MDFYYGLGVGAVAGIPLGMFIGWRLLMWLVNREPDDNVTLRKPRRYRLIMPR
jgi:hypothetical protein